MLKMTQFEDRSVAINPKVVCAISAFRDPHTEIS